MGRVKDFKIIFDDSDDNPGNNNNNNDQSQIDIQVYKYPLLIQCMQKPLFPNNIYATQVSKQYYNFINDNKIKYVGAFVLKDNVEQPKLMPQGYENDQQQLDYLLKHKQQQQQQQLQQKNSKNKREKQYLNIQGRVYNEEFNSDDQFSQDKIINEFWRQVYSSQSNIIYDNNLVPFYNNSQQYSEYSQQGIYGIKDINDVYELGTICDIQFEQYKEQGQKQIVALLRGIKKIQLLSKTQTFLYYSQDRKVYQPPIKQKSTSESDKEMKNKETEEEQKTKEIKVELDQQLEKNIKKDDNTTTTEEIKIEENKTQQKLEQNQLENKENKNQLQAQQINFVKVQPVRSQETNYNDDKNYTEMFNKILLSYDSLRSNFPINSPEITKYIQGNYALDILCGFLTQSSFFTKEELMKLFETELAHQRLNLCQLYFQKYEQELHKYRKKIEANRNMPLNRSSNNKEQNNYDHIYEYLKGLLESPSVKAQAQKFLDKIEGKTLPKKIQEIFKEELSNLEEMHENHPDYDSTKQLLELITDLPWGVTTPDNFDLKKAKQILDEKHYGIEEVKQRILEFIAVSKLKGQVKGKSLLLVGPPGTGKTSVASSIAACLGRNFQRISVGGESDVAIIKGHRKTYVGSYPGKIVKALQLSKSENPVILIDEVEKTSQSMKGNIQEALLEVLDPVQNCKFVDNFLEFEVDLSKVLFVCSANLLDTLHPALLDRMEVIELSGYTSQEKKSIFDNHILKKSIEKTGLDQQKEIELTFSEPGINKLIVEYAREPGMRNLERKTKKICEKIALKIATDNYHKDLIPETKVLEINENNLQKFVGLPVFPKKSLYPQQEMPKGVVRGLAYNSYGGSLIFIEATKNKFAKKSEQQQQQNNTENNQDQNKQQQTQGGITYTGSLGKVMKESVEIAYSNVKYLSHNILNNNFFDKNQIHIHFTDGATPKDGPSAGISIASSLLSLALGEGIKKPVAMTGELSATGKLLKIGGVREKILAAKRENIFNVILPKSNESDFNELRDEIKEDMEIYFAESLYEVANYLFPQINNQNNNLQ